MYSTMLSQLCAAFSHAVVSAISSTELEIDFFTLTAVQQIDGELEGEV